MTVSPGFASAAARELARELGLEPSAIEGSGRDGRITLVDVRQAPSDPFPPPEGLGEAGTRFWREFTAEYEIGPEAAALLRAACKTIDEVERLEETLTTKSLTVAGSRPGTVRPHPLLGEVRQHRLALRQLLASLGVKDDPDVDPNARSEAGRKLAQQRWGSQRG